MDYTAGMGEAMCLQMLVDKIGDGDIEMWIAGGCSGGPFDYEDDSVDDARGRSLVEE